MAERLLQVAVCQTSVGKDKQQNFAAVTQAVDDAMISHPRTQLIVLPECWNSEYAVKAFRDNAERLEDSPSINLVKSLAAKHRVFIVGGTIPEIRDDNNVYNACFVSNPAGQIIAKYSKIHLFNINVPDKIVFRESETLTAGSELTMFKIGAWTFGLGICFDMRFPELAYIYAHDHAVDVMVYPGAFNHITGPLHWSLLQRARAVDNQIYVIAASQALNSSADYKSYGHSSITDPWGITVSEVDEKPGNVYGEITLEKIREARMSIPLLTGRRSDLFDLPKTKVKS